MKIIHALAYYGNYFGGIQNVVNEISKRQFAAGHDVKIITSNMFGGGNVIDNIPVTRVKTLFTLFRVPFTPLLPLVLLRENCDVLQIYLPLPWLDVCAALRKRLRPKTKLVLSIRNPLPDSTSKISGVMSWVHDNITIKMAIKGADAVIFTQREFAFSLPYEIPKEKMFVIPNGVDTNLFRPNPDYFYDQNQILFVGRLIPEKGLEILMRAMRIVQKEIPEIKLIAVVADYYNQREYMHKVLSLDNGFLKLFSKLPQQELAKLYRDSALLVFPSIGLESFGNVLLEAMASGCPVICTDLPGPKALVQSGSSVNVGSIVKRNDVEELSRAIISELQSNNSIRREKIAKFARSKESWDSIVEQLILVYEQCRKS